MANGSHRIDPFTRRRAEAACYRPSPGDGVEGVADYEFVRSMGEGNHGAFFLSRPPARLGIEAEYVAVKVLTTSSSEDAFRRATRELRAFAAVRSDRLVRLYDAGQDGDRVFYSMEYYALGSLRDPARPLSHRETMRALADAARAAHDLHEAGIVHRSIKPSNILLHENGARLSDLGLAQILAPGITVTGLGPVGDVEYLDPAILRGEQGSRSSDVWSLGVTLHQALAGTGVYGELPSRDPLLAMRRVLTTAPAISNDLETAVRDLVAACLAPEAADRPATAAEVADAVEAIAS